MPRANAGLREHFRTLVVDGERRDAARGSARAARHRVPGDRSGQMLLRSADGRRPGVGELAEQPARHEAILVTAPMNVRRLECFVAAADAGTMTAAAERLFVSQSAISLAVGQLERTVGG